MSEYQILYLCQVSDVWVSIPISTSGVRCLYDLCQVSVKLAQETDNCEMFTETEDSRTVGDHKICPHKIWPHKICPQFSIRWFQLNLYDLNCRGWDVFLRLFVWPCLAVCLSVCRPVCFTIYNYNMSGIRCIRQDMLKLPVHVLAWL